MHHYDSYRSSRYHTYLINQTKRSRPFRFHLAQTWLTSVVPPDTYIFIYWPLHPFFFIMPSATTPPTLSTNLAVKKTSYARTQDPDMLNCKRKIICFSGMYFLFSLFIYSIQTRKWYTQRIYFSIDLISNHTTNSSNSKSNEYIQRLWFIINSKSFFVFGWILILWFDIKISVLIYLGALLFGLYEDIFR